MKIIRVDFGVKLTDLLSTTIIGDADSLKQALKIIKKDNTEDNNTLFILDSGRIFYNKKKDILTYYLR